jgi:lipopolysaccharide transport system ATP-binding protein
LFFLPAARANGRSLESKDFSSFGLGDRLPMTTVIQAQALSKLYRRGLQVDHGLRHALEDFLRSPLSVLRRKKVETFWALKDVSLDVKEGEVLGLIGRNGAGKTTLLKLLSRITKPTTGWAEIHGRVGSLLEVGTGFHPELTGRENTFLSGAILGMGKSEITRKFDEIVAFAELEKFIDTPVKHYSSGMYVRLAFAVAAHLEPEILLVDEVLAVGDASFQKKCLGKMGDVAKAGRTIVFVSHNMSAMRRLTSRAIWLEGGQIVDTGPAAEVVDHYLQKNTESNLESVWEDERAAPGDDRVRLHSVRVIPQGNSEGLINVHTPLRMEFTYWNYVPGTVLNVSMIVNNLEEVCVFSSFSDFAPRPAGLIRHVVSIPGDFLNAGSYYINAMIVKDASVGILLQNNVVAFEVVEGEVVGNWYGRPPGAVRPKLKWESEAIEASDLAASTARDPST